MNLVSLSCIIYEIAPIGVHSIVHSPEPQGRRLGRSRSRRPPERRQAAPRASTVGRGGTLNCLVSSIVPHFGQWAVSPWLRMRVSKVWSHGAQWYS